MVRELENINVHTAAERDHLHGVSHQYLEEL